MVLDTEQANKLENLTLEQQLDLQNLHFLDEGAYGCVYKKTDAGQKKTKSIVKIQKLTPEAKREDEIGKLIRKIPKYFLYFAPVIKTKTISIGEVNDSEIKKCTIITNEQDIKQKYVTNRIKYAGEHSLGEYILMTLEKNPKHFLRTFFVSYFDMLYTMSLLNKNGIIHFDLKQNNVMYNKSHDRPVAIDFGMSLIKSMLVPANYSEFFFSYGYDYPPWCFEISIISYAVQEFGSSIDKEVLTMEQVDKLCNNFTDINPVFFNDGETGHHDIFTKEERTTYNTKLKEYLKPLLGNTWSVVIQANLGFIDTWDIYAVHVLFLLLLYHIHIYEYNTDEFPVIKTFIDKLKREIMAVPNERKPYEAIFGELMADFNQSNRTNLNTILTSISVAANDEAKIADVKQKLNKLKLRELKKEKQFYNKIQ